MIFRYALASNTRVIGRAATRKIAAEQSTTLARPARARDASRVSTSSFPPADPLAEIALIPDPQERLGWIAERGRRAEALPPDARVPAHRVPGCTSAVWLVDDSAGGICQFRGDAEAPILKGLTVLICARASGRAATDVAADATDVVVALGLERYITPTRLNGLRQLQKHIRACASRHAASAPSG